jgi:hypothetical protein
VNPVIGYAHGTGRGHFGRGNSEASGRCSFALEVSLGDFAVGVGVL